MAGRTGRAGDAGDAAKQATAAIAEAISVVAARAVTEKKLRELLGRRFGEAAVNAAVDRLKELRLVDDPAWAERFARDRSSRLGKGRHRIRGELLARGIDASTADSAISAALDEDAEREAARRALAVLRARLAGASPAEPPPDDAGGDPACGEGPSQSLPASAAEARKARQALESRLFRRMIARGYPASLVRDLLDVS